MDTEDVRRVIREELAERDRIRNESDRIMRETMSRIDAQCAEARRRRERIMLESMISTINPPMGLVERRPWWKLW